MAQKVDTTKMKQLVIKYASKYKVPVDLALALINQESGFNPNAKSHVGAMGLGQLMPATAKTLGVKNAYDPEQNAEASMRHLGNLIIHYKGNTDLALAAYNAGMGNVQKYGGIPPFKETQNYVKSINSGRKNYSKVAQNESVIAQNINDVVKPTNQKGGNKNMAIEGQVNMQAMPNYTGNISNQSLIQRATTGIGEYDLARQAFLRGEITYDQLAAQYPQLVARDGITPQMQGASMTPAQRELVSRKMELTPEQLKQVQESDTKLREQLVEANKNFQGGLSQQMQAQYDKIMQAAANDPRLQGSGYYVDPRDIRSNQAAQVANQIGGFGMNLPTAEQLATQRYQAEIANKAGIPYDQLIAGQQTVYENQLKALMQQAKDLETLANQGQISQRTLMTEMAKINNTSAAVIEGMKQNTEYAKAVAPAIINSQGDISKQAMANAGNLETTGMTQAGGIAGDVIKAQAGNYNANVGANASMYGSELSSDAQNARTQAMLQMNRENLPWRTMMGQGSALTGLSAIPNVNAGAYMVSMNQMTPEQANATFNFNPIQSSTPRYNLTNVPLFQNLMNNANVDNTYYGDDK